MEDWMKQPADTPPPFPRARAGRRGMAEVPLGSVGGTGFAAGARAAGQCSAACAPVRRRGRESLRPAAAGHRAGKGRPSGPAARRAAAASRRGERKKRSFAGFVAANFAVILLLAGVDHAADRAAVEDGGAARPWQRGL